MVSVELESSCLADFVHCTGERHPDIKQTSHFLLVKNYATAARFSLHSLKLTDTPEPLKKALAQNVTSHMQHAYF